LLTCRAASPGSSQSGHAFREDLALTPADPTDEPAGPQVDGQPRSRARQVGDRASIERNEWTRFERRPQRGQHAAWRGVAASGGVSAPATTHGQPALLRPSERITWSTWRSCPSPEITCLWSPRVPPFRAHQKRPRANSTSPLARLLHLIDDSLSPSDTPRKETLTTRDVDVCLVCPPK